MCFRRLAPRRWWRRQRAAGKLGKRRRRLPVIYGVYRAELFSKLGRWFAGLNGAGYALACTLMIASYTTAADTCASQYVTADTLKAGFIFCFVFIFGAASGLIAASLPGLVGWVRNSRHEQKLRQRLPPMSTGHELCGLSEGQVQRITDAQLVLLLMALLLFLVGAVLPPFYARSVTRDAHIGLASKKPAKPKLPTSGPLDLDHLVPNGLK